MSAAYRAGWDRIFGPKPPVQMIRCPTRLGSPDRRAEVIIPSDFNIADLRRVTMMLTTMCDDWNPDMGWPSVFPKAG